jgi:hypothetical protein
MRKEIIAVVLFFCLFGCLKEKAMPVAERESQPFIEIPWNADNIEYEILNQTENKTVEIYDEHGRLTADARKTRPDMFKLDPDQLPKLHPEEYGINYFEPGTYNVQVGDGFGKGNYLVKFMEFVPQNGSVKGHIRYEVFKKERDGEYYHFPTTQDTIKRYTYTDIFGIVIESPSYHWEINTEDNVLIYHDNCTVFFGYCDDEDMGEHFVGNDSIACSSRCVFDTFSNETMKAKGIFSAIYPEEYEDLATYSVGLMDSCYENNSEFLGFQVDKPRIGMKILIAEKLGFVFGDDETITSEVTESYVDDAYGKLDYHYEEKEKKGCTGYLRIGHELTHVMTNAVLDEDHRSLVEGLADYVEFQNNASPRKYYCADKGWRTSANGALKPYSPFSDSFQICGGNPLKYYYATGFCFWEDFVEEYSYRNLVLLMHELQQRSRGSEDYYILDLMEEVNGEPLPDEMIKRYSITRNSTYVEVCRNCDIFFDS